MPKKEDNLEQPQGKPTPNIEKLIGKEKKNQYLWVKGRIKQLQEARRDVYGENIEKVWASADKACIPHAIRGKGRRVIAEDEDKGWRGRLTVLGKESDWQSDAAQPNAFIKIQTALSILVDKNPEGVFTPSSERFEKNNLLMQNLYHANWERAKSKQQLKLFIYNLAKYGWAIGRTYPLFIKRKVKNLVRYDQDNPEKSVWEEKEVIDYNDIYRENLDPWNAWIDDMATPNDQFSIRDWSWRKVYSWDAAKQEFGNYPMWKYVSPGGFTEEKVDSTANQKRYTEKNRVEVYFYENKPKDLYVVIANDIPIIVEPLPISDSEGHKYLSCWQTYWLLRHAESPYGIGIWEAIKEDQKIIDKIRNMTVDQLVLSIYKSFFYQGTQNLVNDAEIKIAPGRGKQIMSPRDMKWLEVSGPGAEAWKGLEVFSKDLEESSGITKPLAGEITGKTAFEIAQAKEAALQRLKMPLDNLTDALETDGYITVALIQILYSIPELYRIAEPEKIEEYLREIEGDKELYARDEAGNFVAKVYKEIQLGLDRDEKGNLIETKDSRFFRIKPSGLRWEGIIRIKPQSIFVVSRELKKAMNLEFGSAVAELLPQDPAIYSKLVKFLAENYDVDYEKIVPDSWLQEQTPQEQPLIVPKPTPEEMMMQAQGQAPMGQAPPGRISQARPRSVAPTQSPQSLTQKVMGQIKKAVPFLGGGSR